MNKKGKTEKCLTKLLPKILILPCLAQGILACFSVLLFLLSEAIKSFSYS